MEQPNLSYIKKLANGDTGFENMLINVIKSEFPLEISAYEESIDKKDFKQVAAHVHKLKHKISILGLERSYKIAQQYENNLREGNNDLKDDFQTILQKITLFLNES